MIDYTVMRVFDLFDIDAPVNFPRWSGMSDLTAKTTNGTFTRQMVGKGGTAGCPEKFAGYGLELASSLDNLFSPRDEFREVADGKYPLKFQLDAIVVVATNTMPST